MQIRVTLIEELMREARRYFAPLLFAKPMFAPFNFEDSFTCKHKEKLARSFMGMASFAGSRRHPLLDYTQFAAKHQMPAVAATAP